jgi:hypothetical protein
VGARRVAGDDVTAGHQPGGEPHDHSHNVVGRMGVTQSDGVWRAVDTMALRSQLGAMGAIVEVRVKAALAREFGVRWAPREDGMGHEVEGLRQRRWMRFRRERTP